MNITSFNKTMSIAGKSSKTKLINAFDSLSSLSTYLSNFSESSRVSDDHPEYITDSLNALVDNCKQVFDDIAFASKESYSTVHAVIKLIPHYSNEKADQSIITIDFKEIILMQNEFQTKRESIKDFLSWVYSIKEKTNDAIKRRLLMLNKQKKYLEGQANWIENASISLKDLKLAT